MAALDATPTLRAVADLDVEAPHDGAHHREIFLILRRHAGQLDGAAAVRTRGRRRCSAGLVNLRRTRAARLPAVVRTSAPAGSPAATLGPVLGEGRGLPESCPPRRVELLLEVFTAALPPIPVALPLIPVALDPRQLLPQPCDLSLLFLNAAIAGILFRPGTLPWHPTVMPDPLEKYKSEILDLAHQETTPLNKYGLLILLNRDITDASAALYPSQELTRGDTYRHYQFQIPGLFFQAILGSKIPRELRTISIKPGGNIHVVSGQEWEQALRDLVVGAKGKGCLRRRRKLSK